MKDLDIDKLFVEFGLHLRRKVVRALLAGNDMQCFTTEQYVEAYYRIAYDNAPERKDLWIKWLTELTSKHMQSVGVSEVRPGVWART